MKRNIEYRFEQKAKHGEAINASIHTETDEEVRFISKKTKQERIDNTMKNIRKMKKDYNDKKRIESYLEELDD